MIEDGDFVTMEYKMCPVTGEEHNVGILIDKRLRKKFGRKTVTGYAFSPEVQDNIDKGFVAMVEVDPSKSEIRGDKKTLTMEDAYRTGRLCYLKKEVAVELFGEIKEFNFIEQAVYEQLVNNVEEDDDITKDEETTTND
jgi:hypothetical protein